MQQKNITLAKIIFMPNEQEDPKRKVTFVKELSSLFHENIIGEYDNPTIESEDLNVPINIDIIQNNIEALTYLSLPFIYFGGENIQNPYSNYTEISF